MSVSLYLLIILLSSITSGQLTNHTEINGTGPIDAMEADLMNSNTSDLLVVADVRDPFSGILINGTALSDIASNRSFSAVDAAPDNNTALGQANPAQSGRRAGPGAKGWNATNQTTIPRPSVNITSLIAAGDTSDMLNADERLSANQILLSRNQQYALRISGSCNLDVIRVHDLIPIWSSNTSSPVTACSLIMKKNGILTLLDGNLHQIWRSDSNQGEEPASLRLGDDGNLTITDQSWTAIWKTNPDWHRDHINGGEIIYDPMPLATSNRIYTLHITDSCQLAARKMGIQNPVWSVGNPVNTTKCRLALDRFGAISLQSYKGDVIWSNATTSAIGDEPFQLKLLPNGTLTLTAAQVPVWLLNENGFTTLV